MDEDPVILALGVILTQVRSARRAIEEVERNTSRYLGFEFAQALSEGPRFGAPPMHHGALRVHVININDLAPGNSLGDFLMGLLGGIGNFIGGLVGGMVGGTISGLALPEMIASIERITQNLRAIANRIGSSPTPVTPAAPTPAAPATTPPASTGETLITTLSGIGNMVRQLTALFTAASSGPGDTAAPNAAGRAAPEVMSAAGERWLVILGGVNHLLDRIANIVNGLIILIPMVIGSIALLISNLGGIRRAILETFQFVLRNLLVLRGVLLTTIFETVASAARLVAAIVGLLSTAIQSAIGSIFTMISGIVAAAFDAITTLAQTLQSVIGTMLSWLVTGVFTVLRALGDLPVFRTIDHVVRILPAVLEPIYNIIATYRTGTASTGFGADLHNALAAATAASFPAGGTAASSGATSTPADPAAAFATPPNFTADFEAASATLRGAIDSASAEMNTAVVRTFDSAGGALNGIAGTFNTAITREADFSRDLLSRNLDPLTTRADALANAISAPIAATSTPTGFEEISAAYERWLTGDGLARTLNLATAQFATTAAADSAGVTSALGLSRGQADRSRASIEIDRVEIVIGEPAETNTAPLGPGILMASEEPPLNDEAIWRAWHRHNLDLEDRAVRVTDVRELLV